MTYRDSLTAAMDALAADPRVCFVGYGVRHGRANGTLRNVPAAQLIEMPVAENLMVGFATGLSLLGRRPVVFIERCDFILNALDAIVNHLDKLALLSRGEFTPAVILRVVVGNREKPRFTGPTHTQDFSGALRRMVDMPVWQLLQPGEISSVYASATARLGNSESSIVVEYKDLL